MHRMSLESKMKSLVFNCFVYAIISTVIIVVSIVLLNMSPVMNILIPLITAGVLFVIGIMLFSSKAAEYAKEEEAEVNRLTKAVTAMTANDFSERLQTNAYHDLGQLEAALFKLTDTHKGLLKNISELKETISENERASETTANIVKALIKGEYSQTFVAGRRTETDNALDELRKKLETMSRELSDIRSSLESANKELTAAKEETAEAKRETASVRDEHAKTRSELAAATTEIAAMRRETSKLKKTFTERPTTSKVVTPPTGTLASRLKSTSAPPVAVKSVKVTVPSAAHIYNSKDFGKF